MTSVCAEIGRKIKEQVDTVISDYKNAAIAEDAKRAKQGLQRIERHIINGTISAPFFLLNWKCYTFQFPASLGEAEAYSFNEEAEILFNRFKSDH